MIAAVTVAQASCWCRLELVAVIDSAFSGVVSTLAPPWPYARFLRLDCMCTGCVGFDFDEKDSLLSISANRFEDLASSSDTFFKVSVLSASWSLQWLNWPSISLILAFRRCSRSRALVRSAWSSLVSPLTVLKSTSKAFVKAPPKHFPIPGYPTWIEMGTLHTPQSFPSASSWSSSISKEIDGALESVLTAIFTCHQLLYLFAQNRPETWRRP